MTITVEQAVQSLYQQLNGTEYKPSAYWTATKTFKPAYEKVNADFVLDTTLHMAEGKGIEPLIAESKSAVIPFN